MNPLEGYEPTNGLTKNKAMEENQKAEAKSSGPIFIRGEVDDYGMSLTQFRIYCAIGRRGECYESIPQLARRVGMHPDTAWDAIRYLVGQQLVAKETRHGRTSIHRLTPISQWKQPTGNEGAPEIKGHPLKPGRRHRKRRGTHPPEIKGCKVDPIEVTPLKVLPLALEETFPESLSSAEFKTAWSDWKEYRLGLRNKPKKPEQMFAEQIRFLMAYPEPIAIEILRQSIRNGWQGLFPPKNGMQQKQQTKANHDTDGW